MTGQLLAEHTVADRLGVNIATVLRCVRSGRLPAVPSARCRHRDWRKQLDKSLTSRAMPGRAVSPTPQDTTVRHCSPKPYGEADE